MDERINRLKDLDDYKLLDVIKNYKRYNYPESFKEEALKILEERGFGDDAIKLSGGYSNNMYIEAEHIFKQFKKNGISALVIHLLAAIMYYSQMVIGYTIFSVLLFFSLILTLNNRKSFFHTIKETESDRSLLGYVIIFIISIPSYFVIFIMDRNELKSKLENLP